MHAITEIVGAVRQTPVLRTAPSGPVCVLEVGVAEDQVVTVVAGGEMAERAAGCRGGQTVWVRGKLRTGEWKTGREGLPHQRVQIEPDVLEVIHGR